MADKYCAYCRCYRTDEGFRLVMHVSSGTRRAMCSPCQTTRKKPRHILQAMADQDREARKKGSK